MLKSKLGSPLLYVLIFVLAISLTHLIWKVVSFASDPPDEGKALNTLNMSAGIDDLNRSAGYVSSIISNHLFGNPLKNKTLDKPKPAPVIKQLKNTTLSLRLTGLIEGKKSAAVIIYKGKQGAYAPNEFIVSNKRLKVRLASVHHNFVIIINNGVEERLTLPKLDKSAQEPNGIVLSVSSDTKKKEITTIHQTLPVNLNTPVFKSILGSSPKTIITSNPLSLSKFIQIAPNVISGNLKGYTVTSGPDKRLIKNMGIQTGDVITHIEAEPVALLDNSELYRKLLKNNRLKLTIERKGSIITMDITF
jgi:general secretion pathway protein C